MKPTATAAQAELAMRMLRRPVMDAGRYDRVWRSVHALAGTYEMAP
jgi:acyl-CoA dehydrogenase